MGVDQKQLVYEEILKAIGEHYPELQPEKLNPVYKLYAIVPISGLKQPTHLCYRWDEVDPQNPDIKARSIL